MLIEMMMICALTTVAPYYDCDDQWIIEIYDSKYVTRECHGILSFLRDNNAFGCANYNHNPPYIKLGNSDYIDIWGQTNLQHEIRHIQCKCIWDGHV